MLSLALVGKYIQHSLSPIIYRQILGESLKYDLLDFPNEQLIPTPHELLSKYFGVSITSPYKKYFINQVDLTDNAKLLGAINCLGRFEGKIVGENTDYLAIIEILSNWKKIYGSLAIVVLGDGVMASVTISALVHLKIDFKVVSRRLVESFDRINLCEFAQAHFLSVSQKIVINTCSRDFVFKGIIDSRMIFWDYNYRFIPHFSTLPGKVQLYCDGEEMLKLQAQYAVAFWSSKAIELNS